MNPELDAEARALWSRLTELADTIATAEAEAKHVKELLRKALGAGTFVADGEPVVRVTPAKRFDAEAALEVLEPTAAERCYVRTLDAKAVRRQLSEDQAERFMVESGSARVTLL